MNCHAAFDARETANEEARIRGHARRPYAPPRLTPLEPTDPRIVATVAELGAKSLPLWRRFRCPCGVGSTQGEEHPASYSGASCLACGGSVKAFVEETSRPVVVCPHGIASDAPLPCPMCIASTLLEGKKARELVHAIATCTHANPWEEDDGGWWCRECGARKGRKPASQWLRPAIVERALPLDGEPDPEPA